MARIRQLIAEIHRRSLWQVLGIYAVASWIVYQVVLGLYEGVGLPDWVPPTAIVLLLVGLPIVMATAVVQEGGPGADQGSGPEDRRTGAGEQPTGPTPAATATPSARPRVGLFTWRRAITGGVLAFAALGLAATGFMGMRTLGIGPAATLVSTGALEKQGRVVLADFSSRAGDPALALAVTEALRADLSQSDVMEVASRNEVVSLLRRMERGEDEPLTATTAREIAIRGGLKAVISGEVATIGRGYVLTAEIAAAQEGNVLASFRETAADSTELIPAIDRLSKAIREKVGESLRSVRQSPYLIAITTPSLAALKKLVQAYDAENRGDSERALALLDDAIALDPEFAAAYRKRGAILGNFGRVAEAVAALEAALENPDRLTDYERYHTEALHAFATGDISGAISAYRTLVEMDPDDAAALNNLSLPYARNGDWARAEEVLERGVAVNIEEAGTGTPVFGPTFTGLAGARWNQGDTAGARQALDLLEAQDSAHPYLIFARAEEAGARSDYERARRGFRALLDQYSGSPFLQVVGHRSLAAVAGTEGRVAEAVDHLERAADIQERERQTFGDGALGDGTRIALLQALVLGDLPAARATLEAYRDRFPTDSMPAENVPYIGLAEAYAAAGLTDSVRAVVARMKTRPAAWYLRSAPYTLPAAEAAVALAEGRSGDAAELYGRAHDQFRGCPGCFLARLGTALHAAGRSDSAVVVLTRYLEVPWSDRILPFEIQTDGDQLFLGLVLEWLSDLHEARGEPDLAVAYYARLVDLWDGADPELQPRVQAARQALMRLSTES
jgi:tetratricopeptide (TPR) repeat protein